MKRIGILGGTFNPIHKGHILLAQYVKSELELDRVILIPTYTPPHKLSPDLADEEHRLNMCRLATIELEGFEVSDVEIKRKGKSYSYQTLSSLKELYPDDELVFITGADMFLTLDKWKNPDIIFRKASIAAIPRDNSDSEKLRAYYREVISKMGAKVYILPQPVMQVSSSFVRENIKNSMIIQKLLDKNVYDYIVKNNLYRK